MQLYKWYVFITNAGEPGQKWAWQENRKGKKKIGLWRTS